MSKAERLRAKREAEASEQARSEAIANSDFSRKLARSERHIDALDESIQRWRDGGGYTFIDKPDPKTGYHVLYAQIKEFCPDWPLLLGDAAHNLRAALDHIAFALLLKLNGGCIPNDLAERSEFPIMGTISPKTGEARTQPDNDFDSLLRRKLGVVPSELCEVLRNLQPYKRGSEFTADHLWLIHDLDRVDKHRHLHLVAASANLTNMSMGGTGYFPHFWFGGGITKDGDKVAEWADPVGASPYLNANIAGQVVIRQPEAGAGREPVSLLLNHSALAENQAEHRPRGSSGPSCAASLLLPDELSA